MARGAGARRKRQQRRRAHRVVQPGVSKAPVQDTFAEAATVGRATRPVVEKDPAVAAIEALIAREALTAADRRALVRTALVASGEDPGSPLLTGYDLTNGSLAEQWFYRQALEAGFTEVVTDHWPSETEGLEVNDLLVFRANENDHVYRLPDGTLAHVMARGGMMSVHTAGPSNETAREACSAFRAQYPASYLSTEGDSRVPITFWSDSPFGPQPRLRRIEASEWEPIAGNYAASAQAELERLMGWTDGPDADGQLLLWQGPPGTGKTWALRALASEWAPWAEFHFITDPDAFFVRNPSYMIDVLLSDSYMAVEAETGDIYQETDPLGKWRILILEDTGELLSADAKEQYGQGLSRLLNVVDGMIGQGLRVLAIVTTNDELGELHPAVSRPGRCASQIEFGPLSAAEASVFLGETVDEGGTLAELYARTAAEPEDAFARMACAGCDHAYSAHLGDVGPCTMDGCSCTGYEAASEASAESEDESGKTAVVNLTVPDGAIQAAATRAVLALVADDGIEFVSAATGATLTLEELGERIGGAFTFDVAEAPAVDGIVIHPPEVTTDVEWTAIFAPEGKMTSDGRAFAPGSIRWRELPLTLMAMTETSEGGHIGAELAGRIDRIWRDEAAGLIRAAGVFDTGEYGQEIARLVAERKLRGVSVDLAIHRYEVGPRSDWFDEDGNWAPKEAAEIDDRPLLDILYDETEPDVAVVLEAEIGMSTVCMFPAFAEATIEVGASLVAGASPAIWTVTGQAGFTAVQKAPGGPLAALAVPGGASVAEPCSDCGEALSASAAGATQEGSSGAHGILAEWPENVQTAESTSLAEGNGGDSAEAVTRSGASPVHSPSSSASSAGNLFPADVGNAREGPSARLAGPSGRGDSHASDTPVSTKRRALRARSASANPSGSGRGLLAEDASSEPPPSGGTQGSTSTGMSSDPSWRGRSTGARSASSRSRTNPDAAPSSTPILITDQEGRNFGGGSAGHAIEGLAASATTPSALSEQSSTFDVPASPPREWFNDPELPEPSPLTVTNKGQIFGHAALFGTCHIGIQGRCQTPPHSLTGYAYLHLGEVLCAGGERVAVGTITLDTGHAANGLGRAEATRHYDDTGTAVAYVRCGEDEHGIWVAGALRPDVAADKASLLRGAKLSGDWRKVDGNLELVALLTVNVPGFPVPRARQEYAGAEVVTLVAAGIPIFESDIDPADLERFEALRAHAEFAALAAEAA